MLDQILSAFDGYLLSLWGPFALLILCGFGLPIPEDIILFAAGFLGADYDHPLVVTIVLMYMGILIGDLLIYYIGRLFGHKILNSRLGRLLVDPDRLPRIQQLFLKYGSGVVFVGRFLPGLRAPVYLTSGTLRFPLLKFILLDGAAALISAPLFVWLGRFLGDKYAEDFDRMQKTLGVTKMVFIGVAVAVGIIFVFVIKTRAKKEKLAG